MARLSLAARLQNTAKTGVCMLLVLWGTLVAQNSNPEETPIFTPDEIAALMQFRQIAVPADPSNRWADNEQAARFGKMLFFSTAFSRNGEVGCVTCHQPELGLSDGRPRAVGLAEVARHAPSLWNSGYQRWLFWDGRADSLWSQALQPFENPLEMGLNRVRVLHLLSQTPELAQAYQNLFGPLPRMADSDRFPIDAMPVVNQPNHPWSEAWFTMAETDRSIVNAAFVNLGKALAAYERRLIAPPSPFDQFLAAVAEKKTDDLTQLSAETRRGARLFMGKARCVLCHTGPQFSDGAFHNTGVPNADGGFPKDAGRYEGVTRLLADPFNRAGEYSDDRNHEQALTLRYLKRQSGWWGQFKTPTLRQAALHPPYMHAGQHRDLAAVVRFYNTLAGRVQNGHHVDPLLIPLGLSAREEADLVAFLKSLSRAADDDDPWLVRPDGATQAPPSNPVNRQ